MWKQQLLKKKKPDKRRPLAHLLQFAGTDVGASRANPAQDVEHRDRDVAAVGNLNCLPLARPANTNTNTNTNTNANANTSTNTNTNANTNTSREPQLSFPRSPCINQD